MNRDPHRITTTRRSIASGLFAAAWLGLAVTPAFPGDATTDPTAASGMVIYVDPQTGDLLKEPAPGSVPIQLTPQLQNALSTSHQGLVEVPGSTAGGGVKVDLQGRFRSPMISTVGGDGKVGTVHLREPREVDSPTASAKSGDGSAAGAGVTSPRDPSAPSAR